MLYRCIFTDDFDALLIHWRSLERLLKAAAYAGVGNTGQLLREQDGVIDRLKDHHGSVADNVLLSVSKRILSIIISLSNSFSSNLAFFSVFTITSNICNSFLITKNEQFIPLTSP